MIYTSIPYIHVLMSFIVSLYFIYSNSAYDIYYILYFCLVNISWVVFYNECILSYIYKKLDDHTYKIGDTTDIKDYTIVLGNKGATIFLNYILIMYAFNIMYLLFYSTSIESLKIPIALSFITFMLYITILRAKLSPETQRTVQGIHFITNSIVLGCIITYLTNSKMNSTKIHLYRH